jgi:hypothetical protein
LSTGEFPERLKYAIIKPMYKKSSKVKISNYRSISILTSFSKIFEKLIYTRLAKIPGVARDSLRNEGTREMNYGIIYKQS